MPDRPTPPLDKRSLLDTLFPVNPLEVAGGLYGLGTQVAGNAASYAASHSPLDFLAPGGAPSTPGTQSSANQFGGDITAMLDSPAHGHVTPSAAVVPIVAAGAKLLPEVKAAETAATTVPEALAARATPPAPPPIVAYHGSPHSFDRFDISKIGTGEGAQAYGHGLYFADNEGVAKSYRDALTGGKWTYAGQPSSENWDASALDYLDRKVVNEQGMPAAFNEAIGRLQNSSKFYNDTYGGSGSNLYDNAVARLQRMDPSQVKAAGSMYQVGINADPNSFLDWDKPYNQQSPAVQQALSGIVSPQDAAAYHFGYAPEEFASLPADRQSQLIAQTPPTARDSLLPQTGADIVKRFGGGAESADALNKMGISGVKYLDQGSRASFKVQSTYKGEPYGEPLSFPDRDSADRHVANEQAKGFGASVQNGTSNYVLFDDSLASILKKYGLAGLGTAGGAAALTAGGQSPVSSPAEAAPTGASVASPFY